MAVKEREPGARIHWDEDQQALILQEAAKIKIANPKISMRDLIRKAQTVLESKCTTSKTPGTRTGT